MEACGGAHHWARVFRQWGHEVRLMSPQFVKPYVKSNKNDFRDADAICEAVSRPTMRFVPIKTLEQQDLQSLHRVRSLTVAQRTAQANQIRGLLLEYGIVLPKGSRHCAGSCPLSWRTRKMGLPMPCASCSACSTRNSCTWDSVSSTSTG
jgi:transposase